MLWQASRTRGEENFASSVMKFPETLMYPIGTDTCGSPVLGIEILSIPQLPGIAASFSSTIKGALFAPQLSPFVCGRDLISVAAGYGRVGAREWVRPPHLSALSPHR